MTTTAFQNDIIKLQKNLYSFAYMLTNNRDNANDLVQDTTLRALDNQDKFAEGTNFKGWIFTIMRNIFINKYRSMAYSMTVADTTENLFHLNLSRESGLEAPEGSYTAMEITKAIEDLEEDYRKPFSMHVSGYKYEEISSKLNLPMGTVKNRIFLARKVLQKQFADYR